MGATRAAASTGRRAPRRGRPSMHLLGAALMILFGAFLPWISTGAGNIAGIRGAGLWTMYAALLGVAGAIIKWRKAAALHAALLGAVATALPLWQVVHLASKVGFAGWMPGPGLVLTFGGGVLAAVTAVRMWRLAQLPEASGGGTAPRQRR